MILTLLLACADPTSDLDPPFAPRANPADELTTAETRLTSSPTAVDLLFIVDSSCSMAEEQRHLQAAAPLGWDSAEYFPGRLRVGVIDGAPERGGEGPLREVDGRRWVTPSVPDGKDILADLLDLGSAGSGDERPLDAALAALTPPLSTTWNAGFRREGAELHLVFLTDEDDVSTTSPRELAAELAALEPAPASVTAWSISGGARSCPTASASPRLLEVVEATAGGWWSVCALYDFAFAAGLREGLDLGPAVVALSDAPDPTTLEVHAQTQRGELAGVLDPTADCPADRCFVYTYDPVRVAVLIPEHVRGPDTIVTVTYAPLRDL
jgi:hypothetical protein